MTTSTIARLETTIDRLGVAVEPDGDAREIEGVLNPASARTRDGKLLLYPRSVARGNVSRVAILEASGPETQPVFTRAGYALEPAEPFEMRSSPGGFGCEDPRITFVPLLDAYVMCYTAFGPNGPRIAVALSSDAYEWRRLGLVDFSAPGLPHGDDKDAAFFPEPVLSPNGVPSFAFYHRPMLHLSAADSRAAVPIVLGLSPDKRECTRIAYVPLDAALADPKNLLRVAESALALEAGDAWGRIKNGAGTPPIRIAEGWFSLFHGVDAVDHGNGIGMRYSAGIVIHDAERPDRILYRSPEPLFVPETIDEVRGMVNNVVFPTAIDVRRGASPRDYDVYYGMADSRIGRVRVRLGASELDADGAAETAA